MICRQGQFGKWVASVLFLMLAGKALAQAALYYVDFEATQNRPHHGLAAFNELNVNATVFESESFADALAGGGYSFVLIESYGNTLDSRDITALITFIQGGGRAVVNYWDLDSSSALQAALGVSVAQDIFTPQPISIWEGAHPANNGLAGTLALGENANSWSDDGDKLTLLSGSIALAGYTSTPTAGEAAIVLANDGRTIVNGFLATDFSESDMVALYKAQITTVAAIPEPSTYTLLAVGGGLLWLTARRRRA